MEEALGIPVVPISAAKNEGVDELIEHAMHVAIHRERPGRMDFCDAEGQDGGAVHRGIHSIMHLIDDHAHKNIYIGNLPLLLLTNHLQGNG